MKKPVPDIDNLSDLILHMYAHSTYRDCGYDKMDREMRDLYLFVTDRPKMCDECGQVVPYAEDEKP